jgi:hypothetical protein
MGSKTNYLENKILDHVLKNTSYTPPATVYLALCTSDPTETGAAGTEVSGGSYARQAAAFGSASGGTSSNSGTITFPTATGNWGTITHFAIFDASSAGNCLYYGALTTSKTINTGDVAKWNAGDLVVNED